MPTEVARSDNHVITADGGVLTCRIFSRPELTAEEGATSARRLADTLVAEVSRPGSPVSALLLDMRDGPSVFGPVTRDMMLELLTWSTWRGLRTAILIGGAAIQRLQFTSLCQSVGDLAQVFDDEQVATSWLEGR